MLYSQLLKWHKSFSKAKHCVNLSSPLKSTYKTFLCFVIFQTFQFYQVATSDCHSLHIFFLILCWLISEKVWKILSYNPDSQNCPHSCRTAVWSRANPLGAGADCHWLSGGGVGMAEYFGLASISSKRHHSHTCMDNLDSLINLRIMFLDYKDKSDHECTENAKPTPKSTDKSNLSFSVMNAAAT